MTVFWLLAALMTVFAVVVILLPLLRRVDVTDASSDSRNLAVHRVRLQELESDRANGTLGEAEFNEAREELEIALANDLQNESVSIASGSSGRLTGLLIVVLLPLLAIVLYNHLSNWPGIDGEAGALVADAGNVAADNNGLNRAGKQPAIEEMVAKLAQRMEDNPDDKTGWTMLGRSWTVLEQYDKAARAYARVYALGGDKDAEFLADYAEVLGLANDNDLSGPPALLLEKAMTLDPVLPKGLWYSGLVAYQRNDYLSAIDYWQRLAQQPGIEENVPRLQQFIRQAREAGGLPAGTLADGPATAMGAAAQSMTTAATDNGSAASSGAAAITVQVSLDPAHAGAVDDGDTLFIFARAAQGPRMPLAIVRMQAGDLPVTVGLDDSQAMMPAMRLSKFDQVVIGARISRSGDAIAKAGDIQAISPVIRSDRSAPVQLLLKDIVQ